MDEEDVKIYVPDTSGSGDREIPADENVRIYRIGC